MSKQTETMIAVAKALGWAAVPGIGHIWDSGLGKGAAVVTTLRPIELAAHARFAAVEKELFVRLDDYSHAVCVYDTFDSRVSDSITYDPDPCSEAHAIIAALYQALDYRPDDDDEEWWI